MLKNGCYLPVHFSNDLKKLLEEFSKQLGIPQSRIVENILSIQLPIYVNDYLIKKSFLEAENANY